jgi:hypothetical protein
VKCGTAFAWLIVFTIALRMPLIGSFRSGTVTVLVTRAFNGGLTLAAIGDGGGPVRVEHVPVPVLSLDRFTGDDTHS